MIRILASRIRKYLATPLLERISELQKTNRPESSAPVQKALIASYRQSFRKHPDFPLSFREAGFRIHSQHDEDGILLFIFALIGATNMQSVELCAGAVTVPYSDDFVADFSAWGSDYAGASLQAFIKLGREKGYRLVGTNAISTNAFFIRDDISCAWLPEVAAATCFAHPRVQFGIKTRFPTISGKPWVKV